MYWERPLEFEPERFLEYVPINHKNTTPYITTNTEETLMNDCNTNNNNSINPSSVKVLQVKKNIPHFFPFSVGKRTCIGQNLVRGFSFLILANILQQYDVSSSDLNAIKMYTACVALPPQTYPLKITPRK